MKVLLAIPMFVLLLASVTAHAVMPIPPQPMPSMLNQVALELSAEQWATTKAAKVIVNVNSTLSADKLANVYVNIDQKLQKLINNTPWHITAIDRSQDKSGLEQLSVTAEARLSEMQLANLRQQLQSISKPGETYTIAGIDYTPTLGEKEMAMIALRAEIYRQIKNEIAQLTNMYPNQKYFVHSITFVENTEPPAPSPIMLAAAPMMKVANNGGSSGSSLPVSNNLRLTARVVLGAPLQ